MTLIFLAILVQTGPPGPVTLVAFARTNVTAAISLQTNVQAGKQVAT